MGERPCENIYNQLMKNATPIRLIITMKNHPENTQETRPQSHCLTIGKDPPFKLIQHQNLLLRTQLQNEPWPEFQKQSSAYVTTTKAYPHLSMGRKCSCGLYGGFDSLPELSYSCLPKLRPKDSSPGLGLSDGED